MSAATDAPLQKLLSVFDDIAPTRLAGNWDNVGLIAQSPVPRAARGVFLAVDLTPAVADELMARSDVHTAVIYHPVIFAPVKSLTLANPMQRSILRCIAAGIHIYCPHTSLDVVQGGINDWLVEGIVHAGDTGATLAQRVRSSTSGSALEPCSSDRPNAAREGLGRRASLRVPCSWAELIARTKRHLGVDALESIAVCAGSGGSVLRSARDVDVWITGELGHHEILAANAQGISVVVANHTNTERKYLRDVLQPWLQEKLGADVITSAADRDPLCVV
ncbi:hypothetical protein MSPP1_000558 [Malassezia sp. CBS 17886]|nr:hypothetical protein MSPP1_000558 [Malassezia sp. CBS 17886]